MSAVRIKSRVLIPLAMAIAGLLGAFVVGSYQVLDENLDEEVDRHLASVKKYLSAQHQNDLDELGAAVANIAQSNDVGKAWKDGDRERIRTTLNRYLPELRVSHDITHLYLYDTSGALIFCMDGCPPGDKPQDRFTLSRARVTGRFSYGMELCEHGTFSLRVVMPRLVDGQLTGFIEIGEELQSLTRNIPAVLGVQVAALVKKSYLDRTAWEDRLAGPYSDADWDALPNRVTLEKSIEQVPEEIDKWLSQKSADGPDLKHKLAFDNHTYTAAFVPLIDAQARDVGDIVLFYDSTARTKRAQRLFVIIATASLLIGVALLVSFYKMLDKLEAELLMSRRMLIEENQARLEVEKRHTRELAAHVVNLELNRSRAQQSTKEPETDNSCK